jgi:DNA-binding NarL/FixJ family response regulator
MLKAGVNGYMLKGEDPVVIAEAIRAVLKGDIWLSPGIAGRMASTSRNVGAIRNSHLLTRREMEVLQALATGITTREIAIHLRMAERTVEFHITNILRKLEVKGRLAAAMKAKELGIL